jgi:mono/diheme cytochrome c family protein
MTTALRPLWLVLILAMSATIYACSLGGPSPATRSDRPTSSDANGVKRGAYLVDAAHCVGCHTDKRHDGRPFAGGGEVLTPFGIYYSRNITPDPEYGIGAWSDQDFMRALRQGISPSGTHYFPAFRFPSFTGMTDRDILDIRAYLLTQQPAAVPTSRMPCLFRSMSGRRWWFVIFEVVTDASRQSFRHTGESGCLLWTSIPAFARMTRKVGRFSLSY